MNKLWTAVILAALFAGSAPGMASGQVVVADAWVRALPPGQPNTAAYMTITNEGATAITISGASSGLAQTLEFHNTREVDGLMRMEQLQQLAIAPGQSLQLAPGGAHLMLFSLEHMPAPGESIRLCLQLSTGDEVCTQAVARKSATDMQGHHHQHNN